jgi:hypothetical protein
MDGRSERARCPAVEKKMTDRVSFAGDVIEAGRGRD